MSESDDNVRFMTVAVLPRDDAGIDELGSRIIGLAGRLAAATCRWLLLVGEFDARQGCARYGLPTTARWLAHYCSVSMRTARDHVRVARALAGHRVLAEAMGAGRLSYSHVRAISRVTEFGDGALVKSLVMVAEHGTVGQLEDMVRGLRTIDDANCGGAARSGEKLSRRWRADSYWGLSAKLEPEHGALVQSAIEALARREGISQPQALTRLAEIALAALAADNAAMPSLRGDEYAATVIHLDSAAVPGDGPEAGRRARPEPRSDANPGSAEPARRRPYARIAGGPGLSDAVAQRLLCSGRVRTVLTDNRTRDRKWRHEDVRAPPPGGVGSRPLPSNREQ
jgi:hypothetical protein